MKKLMKENRWKLIVSSLVILLSSLFGFLSDDKMLLMVEILPLLLLALHWVCIIITFKDNEKRDQSKKVMGLIFWIMPIISVFTNSVFCATTFGLDIDISFFVSVVIAISFILVGNYMPKCKQNRTIGIKIKWTLANEDNWNATHRFTGRVWVICGLFMLFSSLVPAKLFYIALPFVILIAVILPILYSYLFYKKQIKEGSATIEDYKRGGAGKKASVVAMILVAAVIIFVAVVMLAGGFEVSADEDSVSIDATFWSDLDIKYSDIDSLEYRENDDAGQRINGYGAPDMLMGYFRNSEFGNYIRYSHGESNGAVVIKVGEKTYAIGCKDKAQTKALYENIMAKMGE